jgi:Co/Zn/Cd efflux system component
MRPNGHRRHGNHTNQQHARASASVPSNEKLLCTAFVSFQCFAIAQTAAAIIAGSEALLGDSFAMMVDAFTYLFNWFAERQKALYAKKLEEQQREASLSSTEQENVDTSFHLSSSPSFQALQYKKYTYQLELVPPLISVSTLIVVTIVVLRESIKVLVLDAQRDVSAQSDPNVQLMMLFSFLNLLLDVVNVGCFASAKHAFGYNTHIDEEDENDEEFDDDDDDDDDDNCNHSTTASSPRKSCNANHSVCEIEMMAQKSEAVTDEQSVSSRNGENGHLTDGGCDSTGTCNGSINNHPNDEMANCNADYEESESDDEIDLDDIDETSPMKPRASNRSTDDDEDDKASTASSNEPEASNLNMCSAYTHVFADTLRSLAVIFASLLAEFTSVVTSEVADATAAVVVSLLIILSLLPLFGGMIQTYRSLQRVNQQIEAERIQRDFVHSNNYNQGEEGETRETILQCI